jgi:hypothetical protein
MQRDVACGWGQPPLHALSCSHRLKPVRVETPLPRKHHGNSRRPSHTNDFNCRASVSDANLIKSAFHRMEPTGVERHRREARRVSEPERANQTPYNFSFMIENPVPMTRIVGRLCLPCHSRRERIKGPKKIFGKMSCHIKENR